MPFSRFPDNARTRRLQSEMNGCSFATDRMLRCRTFPSVPCSPAFSRGGGSLSLRSDGTKHLQRKGYCIAEIRPCQLISCGFAAIHAPQAQFIPVILRSAMTKNPSDPSLRSGRHAGSAHRYLPCRYKKRSRSGSVFGLLSRCARPLRSRRDSQMRSYR